MKTDKAPFSLSGDYDARKPFTFQGETIARGSRFEWRKLGCGGRKLRQLWDNGFIVPAGSLPTGDPAADFISDSDPGDEADPSPIGARVEDMAKAEAEAKAKRAEAGRRAAETRKAKKAAQENDPD